MCFSFPSVGVATSIPSSSQEFYSARSMESIGTPHRCPEDYKKTEFLGGKNLLNFPQVKKAGADAKTESLVSVNQR